MRRTQLTVIILLCLISIIAVAIRVLPGFSSSGQTTSLTAPTEVTASDNAYVTKIGISWNAVRGATLYRIFRNLTSDSSTATPIGTTAEATFFDTTETPWQTFFFCVSE